MIRELYHFDWNTTDKQIQQQQKSNSEELERMWWEDTNEIFSNWETIAAALLCTSRLIRAIVFGKLFLIFRQIVKFASKIILVWIVPGLANQLSTWGEEEHKPLSFASIHEEFITR